MVVLYLWEDLFQKDIWSKVCFVNNTMQVKENYLNPDEILTSI